MKRFKKIINQSRLWAYAAWTTPFIALAILLTEEFFYQELIGITSSIIVIIFIAVSVFWWWWALDKIVYMIKCAKKNEESFEHILEELKHSKKMIREMIQDDSDRQR